LSSNFIHGVPHIYWASYYWLYGGTNIHDNPIVADWNWYNFRYDSGGATPTLRRQEMIYNLKQDINSLKEFQMDMTSGGSYATWYFTNHSPLSDMSKNIIKTYGVDRIGWDDFENIIKILESIS